MLVVFLFLMGARQGMKDYCKFRNHTRVCSTIWRLETAAFRRRVGRRGLADIRNRGFLVH